MTDVLEVHRFGDVYKRQALSRIGHRDFLDGVIAEYVGTRPYADVSKKLEEFAIPYSPVNSVADLVENEHVRARHDFRDFEETGVGLVPVVEPIPRLSRTPGAVRWLGEHLGASTKDIFVELGFSDTQIETFRSKGIV